MSELVLQTERLVLRTWRESDLEAYAAINADERVMEHFPGVMTRQESDAAAGRAIEHWKRHGFGRWAVEVVGGEPFIGWVGMIWATFDAPFTPAVEIGWRLAHAHWGKGYATEAAKAALVDGFSRLGLEEVVSFTVPGNWRSRSVMERIGMRYVEDGDFDHPGVPEGHRLSRCVLYRVGG